MTAEPLQPHLPSDPQDLSYEQARDGLAVIVQRLEAGSASLEESLALWERGEALARRCREVLDAAQQRLDAAGTGNTSGTVASATDQDVPF